MTMIDAALNYAAAGWHVFPCAPDGKEPALPGGRGYLDATTDPAIIRSWWSIWPDANIGLALAPSGLVAIDADTYKPDCEWSTFAQGVTVPETYQQRTGRGGTHLIYSAPSDIEFPGTLCEGVEIKRNGYILAAPSVVDGNPYTVERAVAPAPAPDWIPRRQNGTPNAELAAASVEDVASALSVIPNDHADWDWWSRVAGAVHNAGGTFEQFDAWSRQCPEYDERETRTKWQQVQRSPYKDVGMGTLFYMATEADPSWQRPSRVASVFAAGDAAVPVGDARPYDYAFTEDELANRLVDDIVDHARYVAPWSQWMVFDGKVWCEDSTLAMYDRARAVCRDVADKVKIDPALTEAQRDRIITRLKQANTFAAVERVARSDRAMAANVDQWDTDPWLLNTPSGVVDLKSGVIRQQCPGDYMTKITAVAPGGDCPTWLAFLHRVMDGDGDLMAYLQRLAGYSLTGLTNEHVLPFAHGSGGNGKGVFINTVSKVMGTYHKGTPIETFTASIGDRHPTELAALRGARLVTAQETEEGRRWAESRIKALTGGDRITARFMRQDFFEFDPQFTLLIAGNHKPGLRSVDEAIRRRFHLIPFNVTIPESEKDTHLERKLRDEWPGILSWMIEGAVAWQRDGLAPPPAVTTATDSYLEGQDAIGTWLDECCETNPNDWTITSELYTSFKIWAERAGEFVLPRARFLDALDSRGFKAERRRSGRGTRGLHLIPPAVRAFSNYVDGQ